MTTHHTAEILGQFELCTNFVYMVGLVHPEHEGDVPFLVVQRKAGQLDDSNINLEHGWEVLEESNPLTLQVISLCLYYVWGDLSALRKFD